MAATSSGDPSRYPTLSPASPYALDKVRVTTTLLNSSNVGVGSWSANSTYAASRTSNRASPATFWRSISPATAARGVVRRDDECRVGVVVDGRQDLTHREGTRPPGHFPQLGATLLGVARDHLEGGVGADHTAAFGDASQEASGQGIVPARCHQDPVLGHAMQGGKLRPKRGRVRVAAHQAPRVVYRIEELLGSASPFVLGEVQVDRHCEAGREVSGRRAHGTICSSLETAMSVAPSCRRRGMSRGRSLRGTAAFTAMPAPP